MSDLSSFKKKERVMMKTLWNKLFFRKEECRFFLCDCCLLKMEKVTDPRLDSFDCEFCELFEKKRITKNKKRRERRFEEKERK